MSAPRTDLTIPAAVGAGAGIGLGSLPVAAIVWIATVWGGLPVELDRMVLVALFVLGSIAVLALPAAAVARTLGASWRKGWVAAFAWHAAGASVAAVLGYGVASPEMFAWLVPGFWTAGAVGTIVGGAGAPLLRVASASVAAGVVGALLVSLASSSVRGEGVLVLMAVVGAGIWVAGAAAALQVRAGF